MFPLQDYFEFVLSTDYDNLIKYHPIDAPSGSGVEDYSSKNNDGSATGIARASTLGVDGRPASFFDGANDYIDIYTAGFATNFDGDEGSANIWAKFSAGAQTDGTNRNFWRIEGDSDNTVWIKKGNNNDEITMWHEANTTVVTSNFDQNMGTAWWMLTLTWSKSNNRCRMYKNSNLEVSATTMGTWNAAGLDSNRTCIGARIVTPDWEFDGFLAHFAVWDIELTGTKIKNLYRNVKADA